MTVGWDDPIGRGATRLATTLERDIHFNGCGTRSK